MLTCQADLFSLPRDRAYINAAYMSPLLNSVYEAGVSGLARKRTPVDVTSQHFFDGTTALRKQFGQLVNADPASIAVIPSASYGISTVARNVRMEAGQNLVMLSGQFPSNALPWIRLAEESGASIRTVEPPDVRENRGALWNQRVLESIDNLTRVVALCHVHWADGTLFNLEAIGKRAREVGAWFVIDGTQSVGALPFDVELLKPDALICAGYKWLMGPYSVGAAFFGERMTGGVPLEENWISRQNSDKFGGVHAYEREYRAGAIRFDVGENSNFALVPMLSEGIRQLSEWGEQSVQAYCSGLLSGALPDLTEMGYWCEDPSNRSAHLFGLQPPSHLDAGRLKSHLDSVGVHVSARGEFLRISPHVYNTSDDIGSLVEGLKSAQ